MKMKIGEAVMVSAMAAMFLMLTTSIYSQETTPVKKEVVITDELEQAKIQIQILQQENAGLRRQIAELNEQAIAINGNSTVNSIAAKHGVVEGYSFKIENTPNGQIMKFVPRAEDSKK